MEKSNNWNHKAQIKLLRQLVIDTEINLPEYTNIIIKNK